MVKMYGFVSMAANSMKSSNPHSGIYEAETSRTLDQNGANPCCAQGGHCVVNTDAWVIRKLTPTECARLQGFPDWWCDGLESDPTDNDIDEWVEIFNAHSNVVSGKPSSRTRKQVEKWLGDPHTDSAEYKMWGNGVALPCVDYVMAGIAYWADKEIKDERQQEHQVTIEEWIKELK